MGRFTTPDWALVPVPIPYANLSYPQTLNLYTYAGNNPASAVDLGGHYTDSIDAISGCMDEMAEQDENGRVARVPGGRQGEFFRK